MQMGGFQSESLKQFFELVFIQLDAENLIIATLIHYTYQK